MVLVLALFLVRPGAQRLRTRIVRSISLALGRPVDVGSVTLRLLPQTGFDLENFVVHEDPEFGAEPVLQSSDVMATVRVSSLLRGRLEIARLSLTEPSINLVRNSEGRWNLEKLVERAASTPVAPTSKTRREARPGFPYIEADHGRINFKFGQEKKPYALTEANFALWQDSENTWGMRLKAQPMRTDFNLSDTGLLALDGSWQRSADLHETPVQFALQWPEHFSVMFDYRKGLDAYPVYAASGRRAFQVLLDKIVGAQASGQLPAVDANRLALTAWSIVHGIAKLAISDRLPFESQDAVLEFTGFSTRALVEGLSNVNSASPKTARRLRRGADSR